MNKLNEDAPRRGRQHSMLRPGPKAEELARRGGRLSHKAGLPHDMRRADKVLRRFD